MAECVRPFVAPVAKLVDAPDLGSGAERRTGSSPARRTIHNPLKTNSLKRIPFGRFMKLTTSLAITITFSSCSLKECYCWRT